MGSTAVLFTAFERSGDEHAGPVIRRLRELRPQWQVFALGGERMAEAGAQMLEWTTGGAAMLAGGLKRLPGHVGRLARLRRWLAGHRIAGLVAVDSPAANWSICRLVRWRAGGARVVHLVAPQLWAWAPWRIGKLRRLSDHVLCLLPFEPAWFQGRGVKASFVSHPAFSCGAGEAEKSGDVGTDWPKGAMKLALLPGSRWGEVRANWPTMRGVWEQLAGRHAELVSVAAAAGEEMGRWLAEDVREGGWGSRRLRVVQDCAAAAMRWADVALVVSGTATLQVAAQKKAMVVMYNTGWWSWTVAGRFLVQTRTFSLPNLIAEYRGWGRVVEEFVPHFGTVGPVAGAVERLLTDEKCRRQQQEMLGRLAEVFPGDYADRAAAGIVAEIEGLSGG